MDEALELEGPPVGVLVQQAEEVVAVQIAPDWKSVRSEEKTLKSGVSYHFETGSGRTWTSACWLKVLSMVDLPEPMLPSMATVKGRDPRELIFLGLQVTVVMEGGSGGKERTRKLFAQIVNRFRALFLSFWHTFQGKNLLRSESQINRVTYLCHKEGKYSKLLNEIKPHFYFNRKMKHYFSNA